MRPVPGFEGAGRIILVKKQKQNILGKKSGLCSMIESPNFVTGIINEFFAVNN